jgi:AcrR family transcriptional regulator
MPKKIWFRLSQDRRDRVTDALLREFADKGYQRGSLDEVAKKADVAKGSLFQYFENKLEMFTYACFTTGERVAGALTPGLLALPATTRLFDKLEYLLRSWVRYFRDNPVDRGMLFANLFVADPTIRQDVRLPMYERYWDTAAPLLAQARENRELSQDADVQMLVTYLNMIVNTLALAPSEAGLDPAMGMYGASDEKLDDVVRRLLNPLRTQFEGGKSSL